MDRKQTKVDSAYDETLWDAQSVRERDEWMRQWPWPVPDMLKHVYAWESIPLAGKFADGMRLHFFAVPEMQRRFAGLPPREALAKEIVDDAPERDRLMAMSLSDLLTKAPQVGAVCNKGMPKEKVVERILAAMRLKA